MPPTDTQLLLGLLRGHAPSAEAFWARHAARARLYALALVRHDADADDLVQSVFCSLLTIPAARAAAIDDVQAYLLRSLRHAAANAMRARRRRAARESARAALPTRAGPGDDPALHDALDRLPRQLREVLVLHSVLGLSFDQSASSTGLPRSTLASRHTGALRALERLLQPSPAPAPARTPALALVRSPSHA